MNKLIQSMLETSKQYENTVISHRIFHEGQLLLIINVDQEKNEYVVEVIGADHPEVFHCPEEAARSLTNKIDQLIMNN